MYRYEELDLHELWEEPDFFAESPEGLYAIAQCYRLGKGTEINQGQYREYLQAAMEAGSAEAEKEWKQLNEEETVDIESEKMQTIKEQLEEEELSKCTLSELMERLERNEADMKAHYEIYRRYYDLEPQEALRHLERAAELVERGGDSLDYTLCQTIFMDMGAHCKKINDPEKCLAFYGRAAELGSREADNILAGYYKTGYGNEGKPDIKKSLFYLERALKDGTDQERYKLGLEYIKCGFKLKGYAIFEEIGNKEGIDPKLRILCKINHPGRKEEEVIQDAWALGDMQDEIGEYLYNYYKGKKPENVSEEYLPTPEQAFQLGLWNQKVSGRYGSWMEWSAQNGYEQAKECMKEEHLKDIAQEEERQRQEERRRKQEEERQKREKERREKERLEKERLEMERQRQEEEHQKREREEKECQEKQLRREKKKERRKKKIAWILKYWIYLFIMLDYIVYIAFVNKDAIIQAISNRNNSKMATSKEIQLNESESSPHTSIEDDNRIEVDPFENLQIKVSGSSPFVSVEVAYVGMDPFLQKVKYTLSKDNSLKDGENILIEASVDSSVENEYGKKLSVHGMSYTIQTDSYWIMPDTEVTTEQLGQLSELVESYLKSEFGEMYSFNNLSEYLNEITDNTVGSAYEISAEFENVQPVVAYMVEGKLPGRYQEKDMENPRVGWLYCVLETVGSYKGDFGAWGTKSYGKIESPLYYVVPVCVHCEGENILDFDFDQKYFRKVVFSSLEDAEFSIYKDLKPSQKLEF